MWGRCVNTATFKEPAIAMIRKLYWLIGLDGSLSPLPRSGFVQSFHPLVWVILSSDFRGSSWPNAAA